MIIITLIGIAILIAFVILILKSKEGKQGDSRKNLIQLVGIVGVFVLFGIGIMWVGSYGIENIESHSSSLEPLIIEKDIGNIESIRVVPTESQVGRYLTGEHSGKTHGRFMYEIIDTSGLMHRISVRWIKDGDHYEILQLSE